MARFINWGVEVDGQHEAYWVNIDEVVAIKTVRGKEHSVVFEFTSGNKQINIFEGDSAPSNVNYIVERLLSNDKESRD